MGLDESGGHFGIFSHPNRGQRSANGHRLVRTFRLGWQLQNLDKSGEIYIAEFSLTFEKLLQQ